MNSECSYLGWQQFQGVLGFYWINGKVIRPDLCKVEFTNSLFSIRTINSFVFFDIFWTPDTYQSQTVKQKT